MAVRTDLPQIAALKIAAEKRFGHKIESRSDFSLLGLEIERITNEHLADNTLRRLWGTIKGYNTTYTRTLDVLCKYIGFEHWDAYCCHLKQSSTPESEIVRKHFAYTLPSRRMTFPQETESASDGFLTASASSNF